MVDYYLFIVWLTTLLLNVSPSLGNLDIDELTNIHYGVDILDKPLILDEDDIVLSSKYGQLYRCSFTSALQAEKSRRKMNDDVNVDQQSIVELLKPLETAACLIHTTGWWTYELCYKNVLKQYHLDAKDGKIAGDTLVLGYFESDFDWTLDSVNTSLEAKRRYHSQNYVNGSVCDLTGQPRQTAVHVMCVPKATVDFIYRVEEPSTCSYLVTVHSPRVCSHQMLSQPKEKQIVPIKCHPALSQSQLARYDALHSTTSSVEDDSSSVSNQDDSNKPLKHDDLMSQSGVEREEPDIMYADSGTTVDGEEIVITASVNEVKVDGVTARFEVHHSAQIKQSTGADASQDKDADMTEASSLDGVDLSPPERGVVKILNAAYFDKDGRPVGKYEQTSETTLDQLVMAVLGTNEEEIAEFKGHRRLQDNYRFLWKDSSEEETEEQSNAKQH